MDILRKTNLDINWKRKRQKMLRHPVSSTSSSTFSRTTMWTDSDTYVLPSLLGDPRHTYLSPSQRTLSRQIMRNWEVWKTNIEKSNNHRILQQLDFHTQQNIQDTSVQDLDPRPSSHNVQCPHVRFTPRNGGYWIRWKSYPYDYLEIFGVPMSCQETKTEIIIVAIL